MDRLTRLYAVAEDLRRAAPRLVTVTELARRHGVSTRTLQRDLRALMEAGLPVRWEDGRGGGWTVDASMTLPPINLTGDEAAAVLLAMGQACGNAPLASAGESALAKIASVVGAAGTEGMQSWRNRVAVARPVDADKRAAIETAVAEFRLLHLRYRDGRGESTERQVEPIGLLTSRGSWYLIAWCRLREAPRAFRFDRIDSAVVGAERVPARDLRDTLAGEGPDLLPGWPDRDG